MSHEDKDRNGALFLYQQDVSASQGELKIASKAPEARASQGLGQILSHLDL